MNNNDVKYPRLSKECLVLAQQIAHEVWNKYDDQFGYRSEKQNRNDNTPLDQDAMFFFWQQFDSDNQKDFLTRVAGLSINDDNALKLLNWIEVWIVDCQSLYLASFLEGVKKNDENLD